MGSPSPSIIERVTRVYPNQQQTITSFIQRDIVHRTSYYLLTWRRSYGNQIVADATLAAHQGTYPKSFEQFNHLILDLTSENI